MALVRFAAAPPDPRQAVTAAADALAGLIDDRDGLVEQVIAAVGAGPAGGGLEAVGAEALRRLWDFGAADGGAAGWLSRLVRHAALVAGARALLRTSLASSADARAWRSAWWTAATAAIDESPPDVAERLTTLATAVSAYLTDEQVRAPELLELAGEAYGDPIRMAYALYQDPERAAEIVARNKLEDPGFLAGRVEAVAGEGRQP